MNIEVAEVHFTIMKLQRAILLYLRSVNVNMTPRELYVLHFGNIEEYKQKAFKIPIRPATNQVVSPIQEQRR